MALTDSNSTGEHPPHAESLARARPAWLTDMIWGWCCAAAGVLVGLLWRLLVGSEALVLDKSEALVSVDISLAGVSLLAGVAVGALVARYPGPVPVRRFGAAVVGSVLGAGLAWATGRLAGAPPVHAMGMAFLWPVAASAVVFGVTAWQFADRRH